MSNLSKSEHDELCCIYAGLLLWDDKVDITADRLNKVITASGNKVEGYYPEFFAKYLAEEDIEKLLTNVGGAAVAAQVAEVAPAKEGKVLS